MSLLRGSAAFILLMVSQNIVRAQLAVDTNETPNQLVKTILSNSIVAYNIKYTGEHGAIGYFDGTHSNIGLNNGVIMTTGRATNAIGPSNPGNKGINNGLPGDSALTAISGDSTYDACILEFDFVPYADTMSFDFVFGSEEYPEFTCCKVNDVFAFFISGPGIVGEKNIALVPKTAIPISINTLNGNCFVTSSCGGACCGSNSSYYIDNTAGPTVQYAGFTTVMKAISAVKCGQQYHIRIAIADAGDHYFDSGVFLGGGSFRGGTNSLNIVATPGDSICPNTEVSVFFPDNDPTHNFTWSFDGATVESGFRNGPYTVNWPDAGVKQIRVSVSGPCAYDLDSLSINVGACDVRVPNVFTPGIEGVNSIFHIGNLEKYPNTNLIVYNRWGNIVYYSTNYQNDWNGGKLPSGTYYYVLTLANGEVNKGFVELLRS